MANIPLPAASPRENRPRDFIGSCISQQPADRTSKCGGVELVTNHDELMSNFFAQPDALAIGKSKSDLGKPKEFQKSYGLQRISWEPSFIVVIVF